MVKEYYMGSGIKTWKSGRAQTIEFIVTQDCNLRCAYCYQTHKNNKGKMSVQVGKDTIDYLLNNPEMFAADSVIFEFIGGEPLLEIDLIKEIVDYFKVRAYELNHKWFNSYRISITTNGILYSSEKVQKFIKENRSNLGICITIDGTKEKHDIQRVYPDGRGSYDDVVKNIKLWLKQYPNYGTKVTIGHNDLPYVKESIIHLYNLGLNMIPANVVYEDVWEDGDDEIFEQQLIELADYIIDNKLWNEFNTTLFTDVLGTPNTISKLETNWCSSGKMLAVDSEGNLFPCLRYMKYSLNNNKPRCIGSIYDGIDVDKIRPFLAINGLSQSSQECINCEIATGCSWCQGNNYDCSEVGTSFNRVTYICKMHKARCRANNYFWTKLKKTAGIDRDGYSGLTKQLYMITSDDCAEHCNYESNTKDINFMDEQTFKAGLEYAYKNFFKPVILYSKSGRNVENIKNILNSSCKEAVENDCLEIFNSNIAQNFTNGIEIISDSSSDREVIGDTCILKIKENNLEQLSDTAIILFKDVNRINLVIPDLDKSFNYKLYKDQLNKIKDYIISDYKGNLIKEINVLTDLLFIDKMDNCNAGDKSFALAPNGKIYLCPAFYFNDENDSIGDLENGISIEKYNSLFKAEGSPVCSKCEALHCSRCIYLNKTFTDEYNVSPAVQCRKSYLEREISKELSSALIKAGACNIKEITDVDYSDPLEIAIDKSVINPYNIFN